MLVVIQLLELLPRRIFFMIRVRNELGVAGGDLPDASFPLMLVSEEEIDNHL